jgi:Molybdopterin-binding domain of aldehyde dehydrogenase
LRGIGVANYLDTATGVARERTEMTVHPDGWVDVVIGTSSQGQGHETSFAQLVNEWLDVPIENVRFLTHDSDLLVFGGAQTGRRRAWARRWTFRSLSRTRARSRHPGGGTALAPTCPFSVQWTKVWPVLGVAITVRELPAGNVPSLLTVPSSPGGRTPQARRGPFVRDHRQTSAPSARKNQNPAVI